MHAATPRIVVFKELYFPNMKYLEIAVIFTLSIFLQKNVKIMKKLSVLITKYLYNLHIFLVNNTINILI